MNINDPICALSTPAGAGAIAVIRVSGKTATSLCEPFIKINASTLTGIKPNRAQLAFFSDGHSEIDQVVVTFFKEPHSYTGEDMIEISCHGSQFIQKRILETLIKGGMRHAKPGEFTQRAFLNGKMDLSQAEAVADLIASGSEAAHKFAMNQMRGGFSKEINQLRNELLHFISLIELELDFSEEDVEFADRKKLKELVHRINSSIAALMDTFEYGNAIKNGVPVAIIGRTNSGKSTLLNRFLHDERAIVSEIPGTTRDFIEDSIQIQGIQFRFIDTAGLRHTDDIIENQGIQRSIGKFKQANIIVLVCDIIDTIDETNKTVSFIKDYETELREKQLIFALNKSDLLENSHIQEKVDIFKSEFGNYGKVIPISAKNGSGIEKLEEVLLTEINSKSTQSDIVITNARHFEALYHASVAIKRVETGIDEGIPTDLLAQDIRETLHYLGEITGEITNDEVLGNIFKNFCIGK